jgi:hypothetical protein
MKDTTKDKPFERIALITYNVVGEGIYGDVIKLDGREIYIVQNRSKYFWWGKGPKGDSDAARREVAIETMDDALQIPLQEMDKIFLYIGQTGGEEVIGRTKDIAPEKITYVMCDCNLRLKEHIIKGMGNEKAEIIMSECGGQRTMEKILKSYLK